MLLSQLLLISRLIDDSNVAPALVFLRELAKADRKSVLCDGNPHWRADSGRAAAVSEACHAIYCSLSSRWNSQQRVQKRELVKSQTSGSPKRTRSSDMSAKVSRWLLLLLLPLLPLITITMQLSIFNVR